MNKNYEARKYLDKSLKIVAEQEIKTIAMAFLNGVDFKLTEGLFDRDMYCHDEDRKRYCGNHKAKLACDFGGKWIVFGDTELDIWLEIIRFYAVKQSIYPCVCDWDKESK